MPKQTKTSKLSAIKKTFKEQQITTDLSFEQLIKLAVNTPIKSKTSKK